MAKLDSNAAWKEASRLVAVNRDVLFTLAGVFFLLPSLALSVVMGEPELEPGMRPEQMMAAMSAFYAEGWWIIMLSTLLQIVGILAILTLMRDRSRPTVAQAISAGAGGTATYLGAQLLFIAAVALGGGLLIGLAGAASTVLGAVVVLLVMVAAVFCGVRLVLVAPIVAVEGTRNPLTALQRSWRLTAGNFWRIFLFILLVAILFLVVLAIVMLIVGVILAIATSGETQRVLAAVVSSALGAVAVVYFAGMLAAIHRQLAGPESGELATTFE